MAGQNIPDKPNILFLMTDQMQGRVLNPDNPCQTPHLDKLAAQGVRFTRAYTPNAVCSPARASLMTGLLPHNHGVLYVTHTVDDDQACLRTEYPHWAQRLVDNGYRTGYFGKWHVERTNELTNFGWQEYGELGRPIDAKSPTFSMEKFLDGPEGYHPNRFYGTWDLLPEETPAGHKVARATTFLDDVLENDNPWCCFVSVTEPHDPFFCNEATYTQYDVESIELQPNVHDTLENAPGLYRNAGVPWRNWSDQEHKEATACYYGMISEIDLLYGRLIDRIDAAGQLDNTIIVFTSDHGEFLGAHGLYCKNVSAYEEAYNVPLIMAGPGIAQGQESDARVGLHDLGQTLLALTGSEPIDTQLKDAPDSREFTSVLQAPNATEDYQQGFAEYFGGRIILTQRVVWDGDWKYVFNGFDFDELYNLADDPYEMNNLLTDNQVADPAHAERLKTMVKLLWKRIGETGDHSLFNSHYPVLRVAPYGPMIVKESS
ncbi:MAG: sulfatase-like hydrolase/transferase [Chloroflexota bacterium]